MRSVRRARCEVDEERLVRCRTFLLPNPADCLRGHGLSEMPFWIVVRRLYRGRVFKQRRSPLARLTSLESVPVVETLSGRPTIERTRHTEFEVRRVVPFAEGSGRIVVPLEDFGDARRL